MIPLINLPPEVFIDGFPSQITAIRRCIPGNRIRMYPFFFHLAIVLLPQRYGNNIIAKIKWQHFCCHLLKKI
jgi:hypothetical protein